MRTIIDSQDLLGVLLKRCPKCDIVFHSEIRGHCLYCDSILVFTDQDDIDFIASDKVEGEAVLREIVRQRKVILPGQKYYIIISYFKIRSLALMYSVCRHEFLMDNRFNRFWVQPFTLSYLITFIPWFPINLVDSIFSRLFYRAYCEECNSKYCQISGTKHDPRQCEYIQEYTQVIFSILNESIPKNEDRFIQEAAHKLTVGKRSAYDDLCSTKRRYQTTIDIACIWLSSGLIVTLLVWMSYPMAIFVINHLSD